MRRVALPARQPGTGSRSRLDARSEGLAGVPQGRAVTPQRLYTDTIGHTSAVGWVLDGSVNSVKNRIISGWNSEVHGARPGSTMPSGTQDLSVGVPCDHICRGLFRAAPEL